MGIHTLDKRVAVFLDRDGVINRNAVINPVTAAWESPLALGSGRIRFPGLPRPFADFRIAVFCCVSSLTSRTSLKGRSRWKPSTQFTWRSSAQLQATWTFTWPLTITASIIRTYVTPGLSGVCACRKPSPFFLFKARAIPLVWTFSARGWLETAPATWNADKMRVSGQSASSILRKMERSPRTRS